MVTYDHYTNGALRESARASPRFDPPAENIRTHWCAVPGDARVRGHVRRRAAMGTGNRHATAARARAVHRAGAARLRVRSSAARIAARLAAADVARADRGRADHRSGCMDRM